MRFMVMVKATPESEAGAMPSAELLREMGDYNGVRGQDFGDAVPADVREQEERLRASQQRG